MNKLPGMVVWADLKGLKARLTARRGFGTAREYELVDDGGTKYEDTDTSRHAGLDPVCFREVPAHSKPSLAREKRESFCVLCRYCQPDTGGR